MPLKEISMNLRRHLIHKFYLKICAKISYKFKLAIHIKLAASSECKKTANIAALILFVVLGLHVAFLFSLFHSRSLQQALCYKGLIYHIENV